MEPRLYLIYAWKRDTGLVYPPPPSSRLPEVSVKEGETKTKDVYLEPEHPFTLFVRVRDWDKKLVGNAGVFIGKPPKRKEDGKPDLSYGPIFRPGWRYSNTQRTDSQGKEFGRTV